MQGAEPVAVGLAVVVFACSVYAEGDADSEQILSERGWTKRMNSTAPTATTVLDLSPVKSIIVPDVRKKSFRKDDKDIKKFIDDVNKVGILHPINVRPALDGKHELVCGRRRLWIAKHLGHVTIPAIVKDWPDTATDLVRISENVNRHAR